MSVATERHLGFHRHPFRAPQRSRAESGSTPVSLSESSSLSDGTHIVGVVTCVVPSSRWSAAAQAAALTIRRPWWRVATAVIAISVAFLGGYFADEASGRPAIVGLIAVVAFGATSGVLYVAVLFHVFRHDAGHEQHWTPQVFQFEPNHAGVEFDLWSNCDHELVSARPDVVEPSGRRVQGLTIELPQHAVPRGGYISGGSYPAHYLGASAVEFGPAYTVVWTARPTHGSKDVEIARQEFRLPIEGGRLVGPGRFQPSPLPH